MIYSAMTPGTGSRMTHATEARARAEKGQRYQMVTGLEGRTKINRDAFETLKNIVSIKVID